MGKGIEVQEKEFIADEVLNFLYPDIKYFESNNGAVAYIVHN